MIDTPHNRRKMVSYVLGMKAVIRRLSSDDDPNTFVEDTKEWIEEIKKDWGITDKDLDQALKRMNSNR